MKVELLPAFETNYLFLVEQKGHYAVVDPGDADVVLAGLKGNKLSEIWLTHHHSDHQGGVVKLLQHFPECLVRGPDSDPRISFTFQKKLAKPFRWQGLNIEIIEAPGHTRSHILYSIAEEKVLFVGDVLFGLGCGRVFEGTYDVMFATLQKLKNLDPETKIYCAHEYTLTNLQFLQKHLPERDVAAYAERALSLGEKGSSTVPLILRDELLFNPFLVAQNVAEFSRIREMRNHFRS